MHVTAHVDEQGREVDVRCGGSERSLERYPAQFAVWAQQAGRPVAGARLSPTCAPRVEATAAPSITFPRDEQTFALDPDGPTRQEILLTATSSARTVRFIIDGTPTASLEPPFRLPLRLTPGSHTLQAEANGARSVLVTFQVLTASQLTTDN
jgi:hypothetical protein